MAIATGKKARRTGGNRYAIKRARNRTRHDKVFRNNALSPEAYTKMKHGARKALLRAVAD